MTVTAIRTRMYNVGFGDAFLLRLDHDAGVWSMLIDCGVHPSGASGHPITEVVDHIIAELSRDGAPPHLDVVVATHRHRDHVSGFETTRWDDVSVGEVWLPFTENPRDALGQRIKRQQARKAQRLHAYLAAKAATGDATRLLENEFTNAVAMARLHTGFANNAPRRYFPNPGVEPETFHLSGLAEVTIHMLGPRRDTTVIAAMDPPADQHWLRLLDADSSDASDADVTLFASSFHLGADDIRRDHPNLYLKRPDRDTLADDITVDAVAAAASIASATNNTSLVFVVDVAGTKLLFPGDAQWGLWDAILAQAAAADLLTDTRLYKVGHHGSQNATHKRYTRDLMGDQVTSMMSFHNVENWPSIPNQHLVDALAKRPRVLVRSDKPAAHRKLKWDGTLDAEYTIDLTS